MARYDATKDEEKHTLGAVILEGLHGEAFEVAMEFGRDKIGEKDGVPKLIEQMKIAVFPHSVSEAQVDGFKPVNHYRVAGRKDTESEWHEVTINVPIPEAAERKHVQVMTLEGSHRAPSLFTLRTAPSALGTHCDIRAEWA